MKPGTRCLLVLSAMSLPALLLLGPVSGEEPRSKPATNPSSQAADAQVPWGKDVDGLAMRIVVPKEALPGASLSMTIEIKNVSNRERYIMEPGRAINPNYLVNTEYTSFTISDSQGRCVASGANGKCGAIPPTAINPIAPQEVRRVALNLDTLPFYSGVFKTPGEYRLKFSFTSPKPVRGAVGSKPGKPAPVTMPGGGTGMAMVSEPIYADPSKEQLAEAWTSTLESAAVVRVVALSSRNLTVHEWGVFSAFNDAKYANADRKGEWASLPSFFYHQFPTPRMRFQPSYVRKPILYFYTDQSKLDVNVKVSFTEGAPVVWWPCAASPVDNDQGARAGPANAPQPAELFRAVEWSGSLTGGQAEPTRTVKDSLINQARIEGPALFMTDATYTTDNRSHSCLALVPESERFLYYDGLMPAMDYVRCADVAADSVSVENSAKFAIVHLILVDRRDPKAIRFARVDNLEAGVKVKVAIQPVPAYWPAGITKSFGQDLRHAGLFDNEADSVLAIWKKGLFDRPGITAIYLLPPSEYDRMLPLSVSPQPGKVVRVGIVLHGQLELTPAVIQACIKDLTAKMDSDVYRVRDKANRDLIDLGPAAFPAIREALKGKLSPEVRERLEDILKKLDSTEYIK
jgi:hypothetical protein